MKTIVYDNNSYQIFKTLQEKDQVEIWIIWGKLDIKYILKKTEKNTWQKKSLQIKHNHEWYEYIKTTTHGFTFEETYWKTNEKDLYMELPSKFEQAIHQVSLQSLSES